MSGTAVDADRQTVAACLGATPEERVHLVAAMPLNAEPAAT